MEWVYVGKLVGRPLDWAVAVAEGHEPTGEPGAIMEAIEGQRLSVVFHISQPPIVAVSSVKGDYCPSTNWAQGGPLRDKYGITLLDHGDFCTATLCGKTCDESRASGDTALIALSRAIVLARLGERIEVPSALIALEPTLASDSRRWSRE